MDPRMSPPPFPYQRRHFLRESALGFGWLAFSALATRMNAAVKDPHFAPKAPPDIFLYMRGAPSHVDTFDYKPTLNADHGKPGNRDNTQLYGCQWRFSRHGQSGMWASEVFPELARHADDLCMINSMQTDLPAHSQAYVILHT